MPAYVFYLFTYFYIYIFFLLVCDNSRRRERHTLVDPIEQSGNADLGRHMQQPSHAEAFVLYRCYIFFFFFFGWLFFFFSSHFIRNFIISGRHNQYKRSNIEHRKLVCVLLNASCWQIYVGRDVGEVCVRRPRSRCGTYKASVNIVHIRCQWKLRDIRLERRVPYKESRNIGGERERENAGIMLRPKFLVFQTPFSRPTLARSTNSLYLYNL